MTDNKTIELFTDINITLKEGGVACITASITKDIYAKVSKRYTAIITGAPNNIICAYKGSSINDARKAIFVAAANL